MGRRRRLGTAVARLSSPRTRPVPNIIKRASGGRPRARSHHPVAAEHALDPLALALGRDHAPRRRRPRLRVDLEHRLRRVRDADDLARLGEHAADPLVLAAVELAAALVRAGGAPEVAEGGDSSRGRVDLEHLRRVRRDSVHLGSVRTEHRAAPPAAVGPADRRLLAAVALRGRRHVLEPGRAGRVEAGPLDAVRRAECGEDEEHRGYRGLSVRGAERRGRGAALDG